MITARQIKGYPGDVAHHGTDKKATSHEVIFAVLLLVLVFVLLRLVLNDVRNSLTCFLLT